MASDVGLPVHSASTVPYMDAPLLPSLQFMRASRIRLHDTAHVLSKDGKTITVSQKGTHADGAKYNDVMVYDRQ